MMRVRSIVRSIGLMTIAMLIAGCVATPATVSEYPIVEPENRLDLEYPISIRTSEVALRVSRAGELPMVTISGVGVGSRTGIEWSVQWFSEDGREITGTSTRFRRATINPGVAFNLQATAPVRSASAVHVRVRQSENM